MPDEPNDIPEDERDDVPAPVVVEWKAPASQADLDKIITDRVNRATKRFKDYDALKEKAARADALDHELSSETEKATKAARDEAAQEARGKFIPRLVKAEFRAERGTLTSDQLDALLEDLDLSRYVDDDGEPDLDKIRRKIAAVAPAEREPFPDLGGGRRGGAPTSNDMNAFIRRAAGHG